VDDPLVLALLIVAVAAIALFAVEFWTIRTGRPTISARFQAVSRAMDRQLIAGIYFLLGALAGWFIAHFTS